MRPADARFKIRVSWIFRGLETCRAALAHTPAATMTARSPGSSQCLNARRAHSDADWRREGWFSGVAQFDGTPCVLRGSRRWRTTADQR